MVVGFLAAALAVTRARADDIEPETVATPLAGVRADVATLMLATGDGGGLRLAATALPRGDDRLDLWVEIIGRDLVQTTTDDDEAVARGATRTATAEPFGVEVYVYALTETWGVAGHGGFGFTVDPKEERLRRSGVRFAASLAVTAQPATVRVLVRRQGGVTFGLTEVSLRSKERASPAPLVAIPDGSNAWWPVRGREAPTQDWLPAALPVLAAEAAFDIRLLRGTLEAVTAERVALRFRDDAGAQTVAELEVVPASTDAAGWHLAGPLPTLASGLYQLDAAVLEADGSRTWSPAVRVAVVDAGIATANLVWPALIGGPQLDGPQPDGSERPGPATTDATTTQDEPPVSRARSRARAGLLRRLQRDYREALAHQAAGRHRRALDALRASEQAAQADPRQRGLLADAQDQVAVAVEAQNVEALVPILTLHLVLYDRYVANRAFARAAFARQRIESLAARYAAAGQELAPGLAAEALGRVGVSLLEGSLMSAAHGVLRQAINLDPRNTMALQHLAMTAELSGAYPEAIDVLERWLAVDPGASEAWLRLGINQRRLGDSAAAARSLRRAINAGSAPWCLAVSFQELATLHLAADRPDDALRLLDEALARLPGQRRLMILQAFAYDRTGARGKAQAVIADLPTEDGARDHPRLRYGRVDGEAAGTRNGDLMRASAARLPALAQALADLPLGRGRSDG